MIYRTVTIKAKITDSVVAVSPSLSGDISVTADIISKVRSTNYEEYTGDTHVTPSDFSQVLLTANKVLLDHIYIDPIPFNYGKITWDGAVLTVS